MTAESVAQDYEEYKTKVEGVIAGFKSRLRLVEAAAGLQPGLGAAGPSTTSEGKKGRKPKKEKAKGKMIGQSGARAGGGAKPGQPGGSKRAGKMRHVPPTPGSNTNVPSGIMEWVALKCFHNVYILYKP